eukprot:CCRYP_017718-RB/>CCRYP_017718-RB protein AED:0.18 eAED:0.18 QI:0/0.75/0.77/0.88/0.12/0/9/4077/190
MVLDDAAETVANGDDGDEGRCRRCCCRCVGDAILTVGGELSGRGGSWSKGGGGWGEGLCWEAGWCQEGEGRGELHRVLAISCELYNSLKYDAAGATAQAETVTDLIHNLHRTRQDTVCEFLSCDFLALCCKIFSITTTKRSPCVTTIVIISATAASNPTGRTGATGATEKSPSGTIGKCLSFPAEHRRVS